MSISCILIAIAFSVTAVALSAEIEIRKEPPFTYACLECSGPSSQITVQISKFIGAIYNQRLAPTGKLFFLFYDNPGEVSEADDVKWAVALPISEHAMVTEPLVKEEFRYPDVAYYLHKGPYEKSTGAYVEILRQIAEKGYVAAGPTIQRHLDDPNKTDPEDLRTEIIIPVEIKR
jgi:effector-binding domain-containing protein